MTLHIGVADRFAHSCLHLRSGGHSLASHDPVSATGTAACDRAAQQTAVYTE